MLNSAGREIASDLGEATSARFLACEWALRRGRASRRERPTRLPLVRRRWLDKSLRRRPTGVHPIAARLWLCAIGNSELVFMPASNRDDT